MSSNMRIKKIIWDKFEILDIFIKPEWNLSKKRNHKHSWLLFQDWNHSGNLIISTYYNVLYLAYVKY